MSPVGEEVGGVAVAVAVAAAAAWTWTGPSGAATRLRALASSGGVGAGSSPGSAAEPAGSLPPPAPRRDRRALAGLAAVAVEVVVLTRAGPVAAVALAVLIGAAVRHRRGARGRREREDALAEQAALCEALAAELRAGRPPARALRAAAGTGAGPGSTALRRAAGVADLGGDVAAALGLGSAAPPASDPDALVRLAACWRAAETSGAALAPVVDRLAEGLRAQERQRAELAGELTGARTTGRMLAVLPVLGVLLAAAVGARPVEFLLGTPLGGACLLGALGLDLTGLAWTERLASRALASAR